MRDRDGEPGPLNVLGLGVEWLCGVAQELPQHLGDMVQLDSWHFGASCVLCLLQQDLLKLAVEQAGRCHVVVEVNEGVPGDKLLETYSLFQEQLHKLWLV